MIRTYIMSGDIYNTQIDYEIKADLTTGEYPIYGNGIYITEDYGDGRVRLEKLTKHGDSDIWDDLGVYEEEYEKGI